MFSTLLGFSILNLQAYQGGLWWTELLLSVFFLGTFLLAIARQGLSSIYAYFIFVPYLILPDLVERLVYGADPRYRGLVLHSSRAGIISSWYWQPWAVAAAIVGLLVAVFIILGFFHTLRQRRMAPDFIISVPKVKWADPPRKEEILDFIRSYQKAGFFQGGKEDYPELVAGPWDDNPLGLGRKYSVFNFLVCDEAKTWWIDTDVLQYNGTENTLVESWAAISGGKFQPQDVREGPDGSGLNFRWNGAIHHFKPGKSETESCLKLISDLNRLFQGQGFRYTYFYSRSTIFVTFITDSEKEILSRELGWKFGF
jgi:hypothetical protein